VWPPPPAADRRRRPTRTSVMRGESRVAWPRPRTPRPIMFFRCIGVVQVGHVRAPPGRGAPRAYYLFTAHLLLLLAELLDCVCAASACFKVLRLRPWRPSLGLHCLLHPRAPAPVLCRCLTLTRSRRPSPSPHYALHTCSPLDLRVLVLAQVDEPLLLRELEQLRV